MVLESILHDADLAQLFLFGIHINSALDEIYREVGRLRDFPKPELGM